MKFSIITPTYKRSDLLLRAIESLLRQTYHDWEMIIVNDSPNDTSYTDILISINDARIRYIINDKNYGANYSKNKALDSVSADSTWIIFLDDDMYLAPDTLSMFQQCIIQHSSTSWFVSDTANKNGIPLTIFPKTNTSFSYIWQYLITKRIRGDMTHCIETKKIHHIRYLTTIRQGEEWFFFFQLALTSSMYYHDHNSMILDTNNRKEGLSLRKQSKDELHEVLIHICEEATDKGFFWNPSFLLYILLRYIKLR